MWQPPPRRARTKNIAINHSPPRSFNRLEGDCVSALKVDEDIKHCRRERLRLKTKQKQFCAR